MTEPIKKIESEKILTLIAFFTCACFACALILFSLKHGQQHPAISMYYPNSSGFQFAFGKLVFNFLFCIILFSTIISLVCAVVASFKQIKIKRVLFYISAILALVSAVAYILISKNHTYVWNFAFWGGFSLHFVAFLSSVFALIICRWRRLKCEQIETGSLQ